MRLNVSDFNDRNVMWSSDRDKWVCIDYGLGNRNSDKQDKLEKKQKKHLKDSEKVVNVTEDGGD